MSDTGMAIIGMITARQLLEEYEDDEHHNQCGLDECHEYLVD